jgi:abortive infection bacteriophage resistance protein
LWLPNIRARSLTTVKRPFAKPATTYEQQVALLRQRGMVVDDAAAAGFYLQHLNYYRLGAYWLPFEADHATHTFRPGTRFADVLNLYIFDRELRLLVLDAIERVEVSVRSQWAYQLAHRHGPHAHLEATLAYRHDRWQSNLDKLTREVDRSDETFIDHLRATYAEALPPVWAVCEVMSLGLLSRWYSNLKPMPTRRAIAAVYGADEKVLESWLHHLSLVRNTCAHHSRLWNREFTITPLLPRSKPAGLAAQLRGGSRKLYNTLVILLHCMDVIAPGHHWRVRLKELIARHAVGVAAMDFPFDWLQLPIWQDATA